MRYLFFILLTLITTGTASAQSPGSISVIPELEPGVNLTSFKYMGTLNDRMIINVFHYDKHYFYTFTPDGLYQVDLYDDIRQTGDGYVINNQLYFWSPANVTKPSGLYKWDGSTHPVFIAHPAVNVKATGIISSLGDKLFLSADKPYGALYEYNTTSDVYSIVDSNTFFTRPYMGSIIYNKSNLTGRYNWLRYNPDIQTTDTLLRNTRAQNLQMADSYLFTILNDSGNKQQLYQVPFNDSILCITCVLKSTSRPFSFNSNVNEFPFQNGKIYFGGNSDTAIYTYDVAAKKLEAIIDSRTTGLRNPSYPFFYKNTLLFTALVPNELYLRKLYRYDMATGSITELSNTDTTTASGFANISDMFIYKDAVYFSGGKFNVSRLFKYYEETPLSLDTGIVLYPNPASDKIYIKAGIDTTQSFNITLHDATGRIAMHQNLGTYTKGNHTIAASLRSLSAGIYIFTLRGNRGIILRQKIVKL